MNCQAPHVTGAHRAAPCAGARIRRDTRASAGARLRASWVRARRRLSYTSTGLIASLALALPAHAAPPPEPTGDVTLSQALAATLARNPDLVAAGYELTAGDARIMQAGLRPNPELTLDLEDFAGSGAARNVRSLQSTLSLSQVIELGGKRMRRVDAALSDRQRIGVEQQARELDVLAETARRFIDLVVAQDKVRLAQTAVELADRTRQALASRVAAARSPEAELSRARIAVTRAELDAVQARSTLDSARHALAAMWGGTDARFGSARADLFGLPALTPFESLVERLERNPDFALFASQARLRDAELRLAQAAARPNLTVGLGVRRFETSKDAALVAGFTVGLPVFDRNQGNIVEAIARRRQTDAEAHAARVRAVATLYALYQQASISRQQLATLQSDALPQAETALVQTQVGYDRGRFSYLELAAAQQDLLVLRTAVIEAAADFHRFSAEIERLTNEPATSAP